MIVAIDGVAGAGKSTVSKKVAELTNFVYIYSGALYRAVALKFVNEKMDEISEKNLKVLVKDLDLKIELNNKIGQTILDGKNVDSLIHTSQISYLASQISKFGCVRESINKIQKDAAKNGDVIVEGRDIGTKIFPNAKLKIFLTASPEARAKRRCEDLKKSGDNLVDYDAVLSAIKSRDFEDSTRELCPLKKADDAVLIDSTNLNVDEVVALIVKEIEKRK